MGTEEWPVAINHVTAEEDAGKAYLPGKLWIPLCKKHNLRPSSVLEVITTDTKYYVHPLPAPTIHESFVEVHNPLYKSSPHDSSIKGGRQCRVGRVWTGKLSLAERVTLSGESSPTETDKFWLIGRAVLVGAEVMLSGGRERFSIVSTEPATEKPILCTATTKFDFINGKRKGEAGTLEKADDEGEMQKPSDDDATRDRRGYIDDGAYAQIEQILRAASLAAKDPRPIQLPMGFLLSGPPGVGKTHLVRSLCRRYQLPVFLINGPEIVSAHRGESEKALRNYFADAQTAAQDPQNPLGCSILFIDEIDSIAGKREDGRDQNQVRLLAQLLTLLDGSESCRSKVIFIGATNRPNAIDPALRRPGRIDREIVIEPPNVSTRRRLMAILLTGLTVQDELLDELARRSHGYVPADLAALCREVIMSTANSKTTTLSSPTIDACLAKVRPSIMREYKVDIPPTTEGWDSIGGLSKVKAAIQRAVEWPLQHPEAFARLGLRPPRGVLLHGPPGCSKTSIARVLAASNQFSFYSLDGASVFSCYLGEAERLIRETFNSARLAAPSLIFIDELDALVGKRGHDTADKVQERVLSTLLNEMDGIVALKGVVVMGATNRLEAIDDALKRPGRLDAIIHVPLPDERDRLEILRVMARTSPLAGDVDLGLVARKTEGYSGASLRHLVQEAAMRAIRLDRELIGREDLNLPL